jgi:methionyl-tRNA formyltransferase
VEWSTILGEAPTVAIQRISPGIDTGDVVMQAKVPLFPGDKFVAVRDRSYFMTKVMLAVAARRVLLDGITASPQRLGDGRQYYRLHPDLQPYAQRALQRMLSGLGSPAAR